MNKLDNFRELKNWAGYIKGFYCEIVCWWPEYYPEDKKEPLWNYYVTIRREQIPTGFDKLIGEKITSIVASTGRESSYWREASVDISMHWGITFYEPTFNDKGEVIAVKIGCDYNHLYDEGRSYNENYLLADAKNTIDEIIDLFPDYRIFCRGNGFYYPPSAGKLDEKSGDFYSNDYDITCKLYKLFDFLCIKT